MKDNLFCKLFGCDMRNGYSCSRCGAELYYEEYPTGIFWPLQHSVSKAFWGVISFIKERLPFRRCAECHKFIWNKAGYFCSEKCKDDWVPF
jgi:hypothetical protein